MTERTEGKWPEGSQNQATGHTPNVKPKPKPRPGESGSREDHGKEESPAHVRTSRSSYADCYDEAEEPETSLEKIQPDLLDVEDAACAVCLCAYDNAFKTPKLLSCQHTFCLECLARINVTCPKLEELSCPICRKLTSLPRGQDLPGLQNNQDVLRQLPSDRQRALSVRFKRCKGRLILKCPSPGAAARSYLMALAAKGQRHTSDVEQGAAHATVVVDVGKPPSRAKGALLRFFWCLCPNMHHAIMVMALVLMVNLVVIMLVCSGAVLTFEWCYDSELSYVVTVIIAASLALVTCRFAFIVSTFFQCTGNMPV